MAKTVAVIQARMGSQRLPGKSLVDISGKPMLQHVVERLRRATRIDQVVIATTAHPRDTAILELARSMGVHGVAGSEDDVLDRYLQAARETQADVIVRVTGDCPLIDPTLSDQVVETLFREQADYVTNREEAGFPRGMDTEAFTMASFKPVALRAVQPYEREHATPYYYLHPDEFHIVRVDAAGELRRPDLRLCVDTEEDLALMRAIFDRLGKTDNAFSALDVVRLLSAEPALAQINACVAQKALH